MMIYFAMFVQLVIIAMMISNFQRSRPFLKLIAMVLVWINAVMFFLGLAVITRQ